MACATSGTVAERGLVRVLWVTKGLGRGGAEQLLVGLAKRLDPARFSLDVAYVLSNKDALVPDLIAAGAAVHDLGGRAWPVRLRALVRRRSFDVVHTHAPLPAAVVRLSLPRAARAALVHTEHNLWERYRWPTYWANRSTYRRNDAVIAVSSGVAASIRPGEPAVEVVIHGIDEANVRSGDAARAHGRAVLGIDDAAPVIGTVGNLTPKKDHATLLEAVAGLSGRHPGLRLVVVGTGPLAARLQADASARGLDGVAVFTGSRGDVADLLPAFDVFALSSTHEGLPIALLEAMAAGVPPVATAVGGVPEVVTDGQDGILVPPRDAAALGAALSALLDDGAERARLGAAAATTAATFDLDPAVRRTEAIYERVLATRR